MFEGSSKVMSGFFDTGSCSPILIEKPHKANVAQVCSGGQRPIFCKFNAKPQKLARDWQATTMTAKNRHFVPFTGPSGCATP